MRSVRGDKLATIVLLLAVGCGGTAKPYQPPGGDKGSAEATPAGADVTIDLDATPLKGIVFQPEALGRPPMTLVEDKKKQPLDKQRVAYKTATGAAKEVAAQILATSLYQESKKSKDDAKQKPLLAEARAALADARAEVKGQAQDVTLRMLGTFALIDTDYAAAADAFGELVKRFPTGDKAIADKAWLAMAQLRLGRNDDALATLDGARPDAGQPEFDYVLAWAKWRGGADDAGAVAAITLAAQGWKSEASRPALVRDLLVLLARAGAPSDAAWKTVGDFLGKPTVANLFQLHNSYAYAGRWKDAIAILDKIIDTMPKDIAKNDLPKFRTLQAQYASRGLDADQVVAFEKQAVAAYQACGDKCKPEELDDGYKALRGLALTVHTVFATSMDQRFYQPAKDLYELYATLPGRADAAEMKTNAANLEAAKKQNKPGTHDKSIIGPLLAPHAQEIQACYEAVLAADTSVSGPLVLTLEVDQTGKVGGASAQPAAGKQGMARVAGCAIAAARTWLLPARSIPGKTRVTAKYELTPASK